MSQVIEDLLAPVFVAAVILVLGAQAFRLSTGGGEIGPKGKAYLLRGCLTFLAFGYGEITVSYHAELGLPLTILILCLLVWFIAWQAQGLATRLKNIDREQEELLSAGDLKVIPLRRAQRVINVVLIVWGSLGILGTIIALVLKFG
jgi:hypothetical protein